VNRDFYFQFSTTIRRHLSEQTIPERSRVKVAALARKAADLFKQSDPTFSYEWFYGACGLDKWGDLPTQNTPPIGNRVRWDPQLNDFRPDQ
jgi:hypothetical protein